MDLDELFGEGVELGDDVVVKAQLRVRIRPPQHRAAQEIVDHLVAAYDERLDMICDEVDEVLRNVDHRRAQQLVVAVGGRDDDLVRALRATLSKADKVYAPGKRGGKWYRDAQGNVRYGEQPAGRGKQKPQQISGEKLAPHIGHLRPSAYRGAHGSDHELTDYLLEGGRHGFGAGQLRFLGSWYGTGTRSGALLDAFLDCTGLTRSDLKGDVGQLRFGSEQMTFEEAVFEFFAAQEQLFMGDDPEASVDDDWDTVLNDQIKPALDNVFGKYEALKQDPEFHKKIDGAANRRVRTFFSNAKKREKETRACARHLSGEPDPRRQVEAAVSGMRALGLFRHQPHADATAHARGTPHLAGHPVLDERLLVSDPRRNPLVASSGRLGELSTSQLMLTYVAVELCRRWDPESKTYSDEPQDDVGHDVLGQAVLDALAAKPGRWGSTIDLVRKDLCRVIDHVVAKLNADVDGEPVEQ